MNIPCDGCKIKGVCGLIGSRKYAVNAVDRIKEKVDDEYIKITVECTARQAEEDTAVSTRESADAKLPGQLQVERADSGRSGSSTEPLRDMRVGVADSGRESGEGRSDRDERDHRADEKFVQAAWEYCKEEDDERLSRLLQEATDAADEVFGKEQVE